jgi:hypothetical protein
MMPRSGHFAYAGTGSNQGLEVQSEMEMFMIHGENHMVGWQSLLMVYFCSEGRVPQFQLQPAAQRGGGQPEHCAEGRHPGGGGGRGRWSS